MSWALDRAETMKGPEDKARDLIDAKAEAVGWIVQDKDDMDLSADRGIAVRKFSLVRGH